MNDRIDTLSQEWGDRLRRLPSEAQPPYNWQEFRRRARARLADAPAHGAADAQASDRRGRIVRGLQKPWRIARRRTRPWQLVAAVAMLALVFAVAMLGHVGGSEQPRFNGIAMWSGDPDRTPLDFNPTLSDSNPAASVQMPMTPHPVRRAVDSRAIEFWLATLPREPVVVRVGTRAAVARLEDRIAQVDDLLTAERLDGVRPDRLVALQQERVRLVGSLAQVRYAEVVASEVP